MCLKFLNEPRNRQPLKVLFSTNQLQMFLSLDGCRATAMQWAVGDGSESIAMEIHAKQ